MRQSLQMRGSSVRGSAGPGGTPAHRWSEAAPLGAVLRYPWWKDGRTSVLVQVATQTPEWGLTRA